VISSHNAQSLVEKGLPFIGADPSLLEKFRQQLSSPELTSRERDERTNEAVRILIDGARDRARIAYGYEPPQFSSGLAENLLQLYFTIWHCPSIEWLFEQASSSADRKSTGVSELP
jgi:hypothetical protein